MIDIKKIKAWYRLTEQKSIGNIMAHKIISDLGDPVDYIGIKSDLWKNIDYLSYETKKLLQEDLEPPLWDKIVHYITNSPEFKFISFFDDDYPDQLRSIYQPPLFLTALGDVSLMRNIDDIPATPPCNGGHIISIVGTRKATQYGRYLTEKIVNSLVTSNFIICSGMALGIDSVAHRKTLDSGGFTIAVLACGLDTIYPPQNRELYHRIKEKGLIISEILPCLPFEKFHFPQRNRIVAGLSKGVCVIEGSLQSGAMITAKFALEQGKEVYALPGDIIRPEAQGPNSLISKGAKIILTPDDIVMDYNVEYSVNKPVKKIELTEEESKIFEIIRNYSPDIHIDQLVVETGLPIGEISALLFVMEMKDAIRQTENCRYAAY
ncbi:MAG: DNA-processing protein DprA [Candidatus Cloacimonetes bacterium]|nr:DNA-processing protein DprA [Candidatus Cloacimonadota bacterium]